MDSIAALDADVITIETSRSDMECGFVCHLSPRRR
ncbi:hypothetical protein ACUOA5_15595 [Escherichia coli]